MLAVHKAWLENTTYMPKFSWRKGERDAFRTTRARINRTTTPIFMIPPAGDFDHDIGHVIGPAEHVRLFGQRLWDSREERPVFVDAKYLDDVRHRTEFNVHPLTALLERARLAGAQAWPLTSYGRSEHYQEAVARVRLRHGSPVAMQISLAELGNPNLDTRLRSLCNQVSCDPGDAVLIVDAGPVHLEDGEQEKAFTEILVRVLNEMPRLYEWNQITVSATSLSDPQKVRVGEQKYIRRSEWCIYQTLVKMKSGLSRLPIFSDYGVEFTKSLVPIKARPSAKLSYTTDDGHFYAKGENVKNAGYEAIFPVAKAVVASKYFKGADFSLGDEKIFQLSQQRDEATGTAPIWKWAAVDHHLAIVGQQLAIELGKALPELESPDSSDFSRPDLFALEGVK